ncbi:MAG: DUF3791 domain-containing protein [Clostridia bacterium]|nr:DUF3791 domain-containing protein [Clostridia bacterium]
MKNQKEKDSDLIVVAAAEEYAERNNMPVGDVLKLFAEKGIFALLRSQYDVLHTLDLGEGAEYVEAYLKSVSC